MQSTTTQLLVLGAALELTLVEVLRTHLDAADIERLGITVRQSGDYAAQFSQLLDDLGQPQSTEAIAAMVRYEEHLYRRKGLVTYIADRCLLDVFTDTTERSPTFMLPPFRRHSDRASPPPWAFAKTPRLPTPQAWRQLLAREPRCLEWESTLYRELGAPAALQENPPRLAASDMLDFLVGNEDDPSRYATADNAAILIASGKEARQMTAPDDALRTAFARCARPFAQHAALAIGPEPMPAGLVPSVWHVPVRLPESPLQLWDRLAVKLVLNAMSTATAARMGRLVSNTMAYLHPTNKKLIDRGTRVVAELAGTDYETACYALHEALEEMAHGTKTGEEQPSPVATAVARLRQRKSEPDTLG